MTCFVVSYYLVFSDTLLVENLSGMFRMFASFWKKVLIVMIFNDTRQSFNDSHPFQQPNISYKLTK